MLKHLTILLLCSTAILAAKARFSQHGSRIINGALAAEGQFPWQVAVYIEGRSFCGGSIIGSQWVLTAGHCVTTYFTIHFGTLSSSRDSGEIENSTESYLHEAYSGDWDNDNLRNDIALLRLPSDIAFTDNISPIQLTNSELLGVGVDITVSGWGKLSDAAATVSPALNYVKLRTISNQQCAQTYGALIKPETLCAFSPTSDVVQSPCNGDSGGPVVINIEENPVHVAVVSWVSDDGCESPNPSGFTRTSTYRAWIRGKSGI